MYIVILYCKEKKKKGIYFNMSYNVSLKRSIMYFTIIDLWFIHFVIVVKVSKLGCCFLNAFNSFRSYLAIPASSWVDDFIDWLNPQSRCCRLYSFGPDKGKFCPATESMYQHAAHSGLTHSILHRKIMLPFDGYTV